MQLRPFSSDIPDFFSPCWLNEKVRSGFFLTEVHQELRRAQFLPRDKNSSAFYFASFLASETLLLVFLLLSCLLTKYLSTKTCRKFKAGLFESILDQSKSFTSKFSSLYLARQTMLSNLERQFTDILPWVITSKSNSGVVSKARYYPLGGSTGPR